MFFIFLGSSFIELLGLNLKNWEKQGMNMNTNMNHDA